MPERDIGEGQEYLKDLVTSAIRQNVSDVVDVEIHLEWEPSWNPDMISDEARRQLDEGAG